MFISFKFWYVFIYLLDSTPNNFSFLYRLQSLILIICSVTLWKSALTSRFSLYLFFLYLFLVFSVVFFYGDIIRLQIKICMDIYNVPRNNLNF